MDKKEVIEKVRAYRLLLIEHFKIEDIYLFGSFATGTSNEHSDIDVAVVVDRIEEDYFAVNPLLWKLRRAIDDRIEPILIERDYDDAGFLSDIQKNGIRIA